MSKVWVPPNVEKRLVEERNKAKAEMMQMVYLQGVMDTFNKELREIDPYLELALAKEEVLAGNPLKPGYWHIIRHNPGAPPSVMTIEGANGEYIEPNHEVFRKLKEDNDMWNPASSRRVLEREDKLHKAEEKRRQLERESRVEEITERWNAATRAQVSMDGRWSQNSAGRRGRAPKTPD